MTSRPDSPASTGSSSSFATAHEDDWDTPFAADDMARAAIMRGSASPRRLSSPDADEPVPRTSAPVPIAASRPLIPAQRSEARVLAESSRLEARFIPSSQNILKTEHYVKVESRTFRITVTLPESPSIPVALYGHQWDGLNGSFTQLMNTAGTTLPSKAQFDLYGDHIDIQVGTRKTTQPCDEGSALAHLSDTICGAFKDAKPLPATGTTPGAAGAPATKASAKTGEAASEAPLQELLGTPIRSAIDQLKSPTGELGGEELLTALRTLGVQGNFRVLTNGHTLYTDTTLGLLATTTAIQDALKTHDRIVIPIHLRRQHFGAIFVEKQAGFWNTIRGAKPLVRFYDPYGEGSIPEDQSRLLNNVSTRVSGSSILSMPPQALRQRRGDDTRCGSFVVAQTARQFGMTFLPPDIEPLTNLSRVKETHYTQYAHVMGQAIATHLTDHPVWVQRRVQAQKGTSPAAEALDTQTNHFRAPATTAQGIRIEEGLSPIEAIRNLGAAAAINRDPVVRAGAGNPLVFFPHAGSESANEAILSSALVLTNLSDREEKFFPKVPLTRTNEALGYAELEQPAALFSPFFYRGIDDDSAAKWLELGLAKGAGELFIEVQTADQARDLQDRLEEVLATSDFRDYHPKITLFPPHTAPTDVPELREAASPSPETTGGAAAAGLSRRPSEAWSEGGNAAADEA